MEQYRSAVPAGARINGWIYDYNSGLLMGIASDEQRKTNQPNVVFKDNRAGCPHELVIHYSEESKALTESWKPFRGGASKQEIVTLTAKQRADIRREAFDGTR